MDRSPSGRVRPPLVTTAGTTPHGLSEDLKLPPLRLGRQSSPAMAPSAKSTVVILPAPTTPDAELMKTPDSSDEAAISQLVIKKVASAPAPAVAGLLAPWASGCDVALPTEVLAAAGMQETKQTGDTDAQSEPASRPEWGSSAAPQSSYSTTYPFLSAIDKPGYLGRIGQYLVSEVIGEGGMGYVFLAEDKYLKRPVALKVMKLEVAKRKRCWGWFLDEARATASLQSDRLATVFQIGEQRGTLFLAMELLHGESLESRLKRGPVPLEMALWIIREAALGLAQVHRLGVYHLDIKPGNLWLGVPRDPDQRSSDVMRTYGLDREWRTFADTQYSQLKLLDFGLARLTEGAAGRAKRGEAKGTPAYMSPEQACGQPGDGRSDLFSLGVVLYRLLSGQLPFKGTTMLELITALAKAPPPVSQFDPSLPQSLVELTSRMLSREPTARPRDAAEIADAILDLEASLSNRSPRSDPTPGFSLLRSIFGGPAKASRR